MKNEAIQSLLGSVLNCPANDFRNARFLKPQWTALAPIQFAVDAGESLAVGEARHLSNWNLEVRRQGSVESPGEKNGAVLGDKVWEIASITAMTAGHGQTFC